MKRLAIIAAVLGLSLLSLLVAYSGLEDVLSAIANAGWATLAIVVLRIAAVAGAGFAWWLLFPVRNRIALRIAVLLRFVREAINQLLPVGQIGGDVAGARLATFWRLDAGTASAVTIADVAVQAASQLVFAVIGLGVLLALEGDSPIVRFALAGLGVAALAIGAFFVAQSGLGGRWMGALVRRFGGSRGAWVAARIDGLWAKLAAVYGQPGRVATAVVLHVALWGLGALEVWAALHAMGYPVSFAEAIVIESLGQAVKGAGFAVPGGIGVQEGGYVAMCAIFGVPAGPAIALSLLKRVPDIVLGLPFLAWWQALEGRRALRADRAATPDPNLTAGLSVPGRAG